MCKFPKIRTWFIAFLLLFCTTSPLLARKDGIPSTSTGAAGAVGSIGPVVEDKFAKIYPNERVAIKKWDMQSRKEIASAKTARQVVEAMKFTRKGTPIWDFGIKQWDKLSLEEARDAENLNAALLAWQQAREGSDAKRDVINKIDEFCMEEVKNIKTLSDAYAAHIRSGSQAEKELAAKMYDLTVKGIPKAKDFGELGAMSNHVPVTDEIAALILKRWDELSLKAAMEATTLDELRAVFDNARDGSEAQIIVIRRAAKFLPDK